MWRQVKKCRWKNGNKKNRRSSKEWELKYNILQSEILTTYEGKEMISLKNNYYIYPGGALCVNLESTWVQRYGGFNSFEVKFIFFLNVR
jgi:hypothetical protein